MQTKKPLDRVARPFFLIVALVILLFLSTMYQSALGAAVWLFLSPVAFFWAGRASAPLQVRIVALEQPGSSAIVERHAPPAAGS